MTKYSKLLTNFAFISLFSLNAINLEAAKTNFNAVESPSIPNEQATSLDLSCIHGGDFIIGTLFNEEEITQKILSSPNLVELNLSGQLISPNLMSFIGDNCHQLKKLTLKGSVRFNNGDGLFYSWESINQQEVSKEILQALFLNESPIETLDLSLSTINDAGLEKLSQSAHHLKEIYLAGATGVTNAGIISLVNKLPNLKLIDLSSYILKQPMAEQENSAPQISEELIKTLSDRGIIVIQNSRTPWF